MSDMVGTGVTFEAQPSPCAVWIVQLSGGNLVPCRAGVAAALCLAPPGGARGGCREFQSHPCPGFRSGWQGWGWRAEQVDDRGWRRP